MLPESPLRSLESSNRGFETPHAAALTDFAWFWAQETDPVERNKILRLIFESVTVDDGRIVSVTPREAFLPYFQFGQEGGGKARERRDSNPRPPA